METNPEIPQGYFLLKPNDIRQDGDKFWGGTYWIGCSLFGKEVGDAYYIIRRNNMPIAPLSKEPITQPIFKRVQEYLNKINQ